MVRHVDDGIAMVKGLHRHGEGLQVDEECFGNRWLQACACRGEERLDGAMVQRLRSRDRRGRYQSAAGSRISTWVPSPATLSTVSVPPC